MKNKITIFITALIIGTLTACNIQEDTKPKDTTPTISPVNQTAINLTPTVTQFIPPDPPRVLTICSQEPASLFLYGDASSAAKSILHAIYDGPFDFSNFQLEPVILENVPSLENGGASLKPVDVIPGTLIIDALGNWVSMNEGVLYRPSGCGESECALTYEGTAAVQMDTQVLQFQMIPGVLWSDGKPLTASDSVFSYNVLQQLFRDTAFDIVRFTKSYTALDDRTVEWVGIPGYVGNFGNKFVSPLPEHQLGGLDVQSLLAEEITSKIPMGWGAYMIDEWVAGDHITLSRNTNYFRVPEDLPRFDHLVYRFMGDGDEAIDALVVGECDIIDGTLLTEANLPRLESEQEAGNLSYTIQVGTAWELAAFGIDTLSQRYDWFSSKEVRQAIAMCIDRGKIVEELLYGVPSVPDTYVPSNHPLSAPVASYSYDPEAAGKLLTAAGWMDYDNDPQTPRTSTGILNIPDSTSLVITYLVPSDAERPEAAQYIKDGLESCGIGVEIVILDWESLMTPGPEGPLFSRNFEMAQLAWVASIEPPCGLFKSEEIPGPYPEFSKGWGGANLSGYSNPEFDQACQKATLSLPGSEAYVEAHQTAQAIFAEDLPVLPLYQRIRLEAMRPDMCNANIDLAGYSTLVHLEALDYGEFCE